MTGVQTCALPIYLEVVRKPVKWEAYVVAKVGDWKVTVPEDPKPKVLFPEHRTMLDTTVDFFDLFDYIDI